MTLFIGSNNVAQYAQVGGSRDYGDRGKVVLLWDELDISQKNLSKNIDIDLEVQTKDPSSVPDKWKDNVVKIGNSMDTVDIVKFIIANPSRYEVWEMLKEQEPPEPLILWWLDKTFSNEEYMEKLADICHYGLFQSDTDYLWGTVAFGVDAGVGRFNWPESQKDSKEIKSIKEKIMEEHNIPEKELEIAWDDLGEELSRNLDDLTEEEADAVGVKSSNDSHEDEPANGQRREGSSLLDFGG